MQETAENFGSAWDKFEDTKGVAIGRNRRIDNTMSNRKKQNDKERSTQYHPHRKL